MVADQQAAETKKTESEALQIKLEEMSKYIAVKRSDVMSQLAAVEPAVEEAKQGKHISRNRCGNLAMFFAPNRRKTCVF